nr:uncharacterized protein LOC114927500 [Arachis hypogaea]
MIGAADQKGELYTMMVAAIQTSLPAAIELNVDTAFLHGNLSEEVYMKPPLDLRVPAGFSGFSQSKANSSLFTKRASDSFTCILVYVDGLVLEGNDLHGIQRVKKILEKKFKIKDLGNLKFFLGLEITHNYRGTRLGDVSSYRRLIGRLIYLTNTHPDICFAMSKLSQYLDCATYTHFKAAVHVLRYLKGAAANGVLFPTSADLNLTVFSDSDWEFCPDTRRSIFGFCYFLGKSLIRGDARNNK